MKAVILLTIANVFMTVAWYGHLKFLPGAQWPLLGVILISWGMAFFEYRFQVPTNRIGYATFAAMQLKIPREVISIGVFMVFALTVLGAVYFAFLKPAAEGY